MKENEKEQPPIIDQLKEYAGTFIKLAKYEAIDKSSAVLGEVIADLLQLLFILMVIIFASFTLAFLLAYVFNSEWIGFGIVLGLYVIGLIVVKIFKTRIERPIVNAVVRKITKHL